MDIAIAEKIEKTQRYLGQQQQEAAIEAAHLAKTILDEILAHIVVGIRESEVRAFALERFAAHEVERTWHPPYVRFGEHTLHTFQEKGEGDYVLNADDLAFVDIGIVKNGIEGDAGKTIVFGNNAEFKRITNTAEQIFREAREFWLSTQPTGEALYQFIYNRAEALDVAWNLDPAGHLIGAFPHKGWKRGINHYPLPIEAGKWILEIQVRHKTLPFGAFFEDLLY